MIADSDSVIGVVPVVVRLLLLSSLHRKYFPLRLIAVSCRDHQTSTHHKSPKPTETPTISIWSMMKKNIIVELRHHHRRRRRYFVIDVVVLDVLVLASTAIFVVIGVVVAVDLVAVEERWERGKRRQLIVDSTGAIVCFGCYSYCCRHHRRC